MESCGEESSRNSSYCGHKSRKSIKAEEKSHWWTKNRAGRNPFFHYLAHFRKCNRDRLGHLPMCRVALLASRRWKRLTPDEREPFLFAASCGSYTYRPRSKKVNWLLENLKEYVGGGECQAQALWKLMRSLKAWQQHCVLRDQGQQGGGSCLNQ